MRETQFINQNKEKWEAFEETLNDPKPDPDKLSGLLIQVTDDLSYSRTFYPNRSIRVYLNNLSQKVYSTIYKTKHSDKNGFVFFWKEDLPRLVYEARKELLFALAFFILSVAIGVFSSMKDPEFAAVILGDEYVRETLRNIDKGKPMDIYSSGASDEFFFMITLNNLRVAFTTFLLGVFACIGSIFFLMYNGIMVGAFQYFLLSVIYSANLF
ncbi:MAG: stage II sporulation protein M [Bacteroidetes bacterium]|nr:stage II sporulation protein M [Bacteroidota bacterium]